MPEYKFTHVVESYEQHVVEAPTLEEAWLEHFGSFDDWDRRIIDLVEKDGAFLCTGNDIESVISVELEELEDAG